MVDVTQYPTDSDILTGWSEASGTALGDDDGTCAYCSSVAVSNHYMRVKAYGFAIPAGSTITGVYMAVKFKRYRNCPVGSLTYYMIPPVRFGKPNQVITADCAASNSGCAGTVWSAETDLSALGAWVPDDFNTELGAGLGGVETWYRHTGDSYVMQSYADASYLRVTYNEPSAGAKGSSVVQSMATMLNSKMLYG